MFFTSTALILKTTLFVVAFCFFTSLSGQVVQPTRLEIPVGKQEPGFEVIPAQEKGLFLYRRLIAPDNKHLLEIIKLDTALQHNWKGYLPIDAHYQLMGKRTGDNNLYLLLRAQEIMKKDMHLYAVQQDDGTFVQHTIKNFIPFVPSEFQVTTYGAIIGGYYNQIPVVIYYSFKTRTSKILPGLLNEQGELTQIKIQDNGAFDVLISAYNIERQKTVWIKSYNNEANLIYHTPLRPEGNKHLIFARSLKTNNDTQIIAGTYGNRNSEYSKGIFLATLDGQGSQLIKYYSYGDLENFFKYMKVRKEKRIKDRIERRKVLGKRVRFNYRFIVHEFVPYNNQFVLLGEAFYPRYQTAEYSYGQRFFYNYANRSYNRVFDGFRYTHAVVMGFDKNGKLLWDNSFEINDVKTFTLEQFVKLEMQPSKIALLYLFENKIRTKIIDGNEVLEGKTTEPIRTNSETDVPKNDRAVGSKMDYWYSDFFYASGVQSIVNYKEGERRVFFINKISYLDSPTLDQ